MHIVIGDDVIYADGYIPIPEENTVQFYQHDKFDGFAPIEINSDMLSDFGKQLFMEVEE